MMFNYLTGRVEAFDVEMDNSSSELIDYFLKRARRRSPVRSLAVVVRMSCWSGAGVESGAGPPNSERRLPTPDRSSGSTGDS